MLCSYVNQTPFLEIIRISNIQNWYFEKVVFQQQRILFECHTQAVLEIYSSEFSTALLVDKIACELLQVDTTEEYLDQTV
ncbi:DUF1830 domain-containing protein [Acaryochloris marina]|uniref:DUF1830 domain-containing protein n=1 Tax=Acaryochloris marina (strain MBIC 11017) TaxID=329726 RepID=B0CBB1_ACAM1|nr:DUF1830 domain-containing protein [Acaryochloris marina]ABW27896.1 conserved hypothetical protein [Acaryochloris marina MBIC11017]BDM82617.1 hypothetical protein AM10699_54780 [Acaryochloris marina MBIC10699]